MASDYSPGSLVSGFVTEGSGRKQISQKYRSNQLHLEETVWKKLKDLWMLHVYEILCEKHTKVGIFRQQIGMQEHAEFISHVCMQHR